MKAPAVLFLIFFAVMTVVTATGDFVNEDYEKIQLNAEFLKQGPLWAKFFAPEAGFEFFYYRPVNNLFSAVLMRLFGDGSAGPFRAAAAAAFSLAVLSVYALARRVGAGPRASLAAAVFFALHPLNSWLIFQGAWIGNSLVLPAMLLAWIAFDRASDHPSGWRLAGAGAAVYLACLCKDSGLLLVPILIPPAVWGIRGETRGRYAALGAAAAGAAAYLVQRAWVIESQSGVLTLGKLGYSLSYAGSSFLQYGWEALSGGTRNFAKPLLPLVGWPLTLALLAGFVWLLRRLSLKGRPVVAALVWVLGVSLWEVVTSTLVSREMAASRVTLALAVSSALAALVLSGPRAVPVKAAVLAMWMAWFAWQTGGHVWASMDAGRFYRYHNGRPYNWKTLFTEARLAHYRGKNDENIRLLEKSLEFSDRPVIHNNLALALAKAGRMDEARRHIQLAVQVEPGRPDYHYTLGLILEEEGDIAGAIAHYSAAIRSDPRHLKALMRLAHALAKHGQNEEALLTYRDALDLMPQTPAIHNNLGMELVRQGQIDKAVIHFEEAARIDPDYSKAYNNLGMVMAMQGRIEEAVRFFQSAIRAEPQYAKAHNNLGIAFMKLGKPREARLEFEEAVRIDPKFEDALRNLEMSGRPEASPPQAAP